MQKRDLIGYHIINTNKLLDRYILGHFASKTNCKISPVQVMIMRYLLDNQGGKVFQQDICDAFNLRRSTVSGVLTTMEKNNVIKRLPSIEDPRKKEICLTKVFIQNHENLEKELVKVENILEHNFTTSEKEELIRLLKKLAGNITEEERKKNV